jgi:hypothetical protein
MSIQVGFGINNNSIFVSIMKNGVSNIERLSLHEAKSLSNQLVSLIDAANKTKTESLPQP